ncbi:MAG TPA: hypothetical protein VMX55_01605 [candidate division Zixibacteria bacterium]|nr:hypothetical protein [candidate division Zixibacteria bacterium]
MKNANLKLSNEWIRLFLIFILSLFVGGLIFIINNLTGIFSAFIFIIQVLFGILFGLWYFRIVLVYIRELRKKDPEKKIGVPLGWSIFGLIVTILNFIIWTLLSSLAFNFPKILFFVPTALALVQIFYVFVKANRRRIRDWVVVIYNLFTFFHLFIWTFIDYGVDIPNFLGIFPHTITSSVMWWQLLFVNTGAFFSPTFIFPPYLLNPRYYFAMPVEEYFALKDKEKMEEQKETKVSLNDSEKPLPGERKPFFEEREKQKEIDEQLSAIRRELSKEKKDQDVQYAEFVGSNDIAFGTRRIIIRFDNFLRIISTSIILCLIIITPIMFVGNISMSALPNYQKITYNQKADMMIAVTGSIFSSPDYNGSFIKNWDEELTKEITLAKELNVSHLRYDIKTRARNNNLSREKMEIGLTNIQSSGLKLIINIAGDVVFSKDELMNNMYADAKYFAENFSPDYMIIFNEINGELLNNINIALTLDDLLLDIKNISTMIKTYSPTTKIVTTFLATKNGINDFKKLFNSTLNIDVIGVSFYPVFFGWRFDILQEYSNIFHQLKTTEKFWISETGMESLNYGEDAQAKYLTKILNHASQIELFNADGVCIKSLIDNEGFTAERGITSHFGLVYFNGKKKKSFEAVCYIIGNIRI